VSFGVYVWHYVVLELMRLSFAPDMQQGAMQDPSRFALFTAIIIAVSFAIGTLSYYLLEAPVIRWARGLERRPGSASPTLSPAAG
jgi:peptidoglycan/LPS O-acetylase OafA/YrhL